MGYCVMCNVSCNYNSKPCIFIASEFYADSWRRPGKWETARRRFEVVPDAPNMNVTNAKVTPPPQKGSGPQTTPLPINMGVNTNEANSKGNNNSANSNDNNKDSKNSSNNSTDTNDNNGNDNNSSNNSNVNNSDNTNSDNEDSNNGDAINTGDDPSNNGEANDDGDASNNGGSNSNDEAQESDQSALGGQTEGESRATADQNVPDTLPLVAAFHKNETAIEEALEANRSKTFYLIVYYTLFLIRNRLHKIDL